MLWARLPLVATFFQSFERCLVQILILKLAGGPNEVRSNPRTKNSSFQTSGGMFESHRYDPFPFNQNTAIGNISPFDQNGALYQTLLKTKLPLGQTVAGSTPTGADLFTRSKGVWCESQNQQHFTYISPKVVGCLELTTKCFFYRRKVTRSRPTGDLFPLKQNGEFSTNLAQDEQRPLGRKVVGSNLTEDSLFFTWSKRDGLKFQHE